MNKPQEEQEKSKARKVAERVGKLALIVASPPIGLAVSMRDSRRAGLGIGASVLLNFPSIIPTQVYDSPRIVEDRTVEGCPIPHLLSFFGSPIANYLMDEKATYLLDDGIKIAGTDVINFDPEKGIYQVNFDEKTPFGLLEERGLHLITSTVSLSEAEKRAQVELLRIEERIRDGKKVPSYETINVESALRQVQAGYQKARDTLHEIADQMNSELDSLSQPQNQETSK